MERWFLNASTLCFLVGFAYTMFALGAGVARPSRWNILVMLTGFICQTEYLHQRGEIVGRCPVTNLFEVLVFLSWSVVLLYFVVGGSYRLSLLGTFTAPLVFLIQSLAQLLPSASLPAVRKVSAGFWAELHAAVSLMAYGAFALACVAGVMFLVQERLLKRRQLGSVFQNLPPIATLVAATQRVMLAGFILFTLGLVGGFFAGSAHTAIVMMAVSVWLPYGLILILRQTHRYSSRRFAWLSVVAFIVALTSLGALSFLHLNQ
jgi:ABC-type uncharacterized transport system permease subunit